MNEVKFDKVATPPFPIDSTSYRGFACACRMETPDGFVEVVVLAGDREAAAVACELLSDRGMCLDWVRPALITKDPAP